MSGAAANRETIEQLNAAETVLDSAAGRTGRGLAEVAQVGRYVAIREVGRGATGRVLRAYDPVLGREVALKLLHGSAEPKVVAEARAMAQLCHPNVVQVYGVEAADDGRLVLVMEYVAGETLRRWLDARPRS